jgi:hypothetical protein
MKFTADGLFGSASTARKLALPFLVVAAVTGTGLDWVTATGFYSNPPEMLARGNPTSRGSPADRSEATRRPEPSYTIVASDAAPEQTKGASLERWWMDAQESVERAE